MKLLTTVATTCCLASSSLAVADTLLVMNSFSDPNLTGGREMAFMQISAPAEAPLVLAMYTITVGDGTIEFELTDNSAASDLVFPEGRQDIWTISLEGASSYQLSGASDGNFKAEISALDAGSTVEFDGAFREGLALEVGLQDGGIRVALSGGTDLSEVGTSWVINYE